VLITFRDLELSSCVIILKTGRCLLSTKLLVLSEMTSCKIRDGRNGSEAGFSPSFIDFSLLIIILSLIPTYLPSVLEVWRSFDKAAHYHIAVFKFGLPLRPGIWLRAEWGGTESRWIVGTGSLITVFKRARHLSKFWARCIHSTTSHPVSLRYILILSCLLRLWLPSCLFPSCFPTKLLYALLCNTCHRCIQFNFIHHESYMKSPENEPEVLQREASAPSSL
jgi:hypothetical protein